jgi:PPP family 3-phenylpropionic acid transporter
MTILHKFAGLRASHDTAIRLSTFYVATFMIVGSYITFLPLWLASKGLTETQIAVIYAMPVFMRPAFTTLLFIFADRSGRHVWLLKWLALGSFCAVAILPLGDRFTLIFAALTLFALFWTTVIPLTDAVALSAARQGVADYGRMRLWGSMSYIAVTLAGGAAIDVVGPPAALWLFITAAACVVLASRVLPDMAAVNGASTGRGAIRVADLPGLARLPVLWLFLAATSAVQAAHAVYYLFGTIHWTGVGISPTVIGSLWCIGVVAEIVLFAYGTRVSRRFGPVQLILIGGVAAVARWTLTSLDPPLPLLFVLQTLHGLTFGATYLGAMQFIGRAFPPGHAATAQGIYASFSAGVGMGCAYLGAGPLYRAWGAGAFLAMAALAGVAVLLTLALMRAWDGGLLQREAEAG